MKKTLSNILLTILLKFTFTNITSHNVFKGHGNHFDYIIVGFGSSGSILARKLSDDFKTKVLVLEAGPNNMEDIATLQPDILVHLPELLKIAYDPAFAAIYPVTVPNTFTAIAYSEGREWGGSAAHNKQQATRGIPSDYDSWATNSGNAQLAYNNVLPLMKALETYTPNGTVANPDQRGFTGPIAITQKPPVTVNTLTTAIANVTGAPFISDYNDATLLNVGTSANQEFITAQGAIRRSFSAYEFMRPGTIIDQKGRGLSGRKVRVMGNAVVHRILFDGDKAIGVQYMRNHADQKSEQIKRVYADKVILCAGAINSPKICILSGVGPATMVNNIGVNLIVDSPHMGQNLQSHYGASAIITDSSQSLAGSSMTSFINASPYMPTDNVRRLQLIPTSLGSTASIVGLMLQPLSRGFIEVVSKDPLIPAKVNFNLYNPSQGQNDFTVAGTDAYLIVSYYKIIQAIASAAGESVIYPSSAQYASDELLFQAAFNPVALTLAFHTTGTARMGTSITDGAVDGKFNVFGTKNLMIADVSIERPSTSGGTCLGAYIIGLVAAQILGVPTPPVL